MQFLSPTIIGAAAGPLVTPPVVFTLALPKSIGLQATFVYGGAGGTSVDAFVQTNLDGGSIQWSDVAHFAFTTSSGVVVAKAITDTAFVQASPTDGSLAAGTVNNLIGPLWRTKYTSVGNYSASPGTVTFSANPVTGSSIVLGGTTVGFVTVGAVVNQINIGATLGATLAVLAGFLNSSSDPNISKSTYTASPTVLTVNYPGVGPFVITASTSPASNGTAVSAFGLTTLQVDAATA